MSNVKFACPACGANTKVNNSKLVTLRVIRRGRKCLGPEGHTFGTFETIYAPTHGITRYNEYGCRCKVCAAAKARNNKSRRGALKAMKEAQA